MSDDGFEGDHFEVVELKVMLESNEEDYMEVLSRIREIYRLISTGTSERHTDVLKAKYMRRRVDEIKFSNLCAREEVIRGRHELRQIQQEFDMDLEHEVTILEQQKMQLMEILQQKQIEIERNHQEAQRIDTEIEIVKQEATENILKIVKMWREDQKEKMETMSSDLTSIDKQSTIRLQVPISIDLSSSSESKSDERKSIENSEVIQKSESSDSNTKISYLYSTKRLSSTQSMNL